jgi:ribonuclease PH
LAGRCAPRIDLTKLGTAHPIWIDCDVLQADGGTRTAAITGAWVALQLALRKLVADGELPTNAHRRTSRRRFSVGIVNGRPLLDLCYVEDAAADVDMNLVMTATGKFIELQGSRRGIHLFLGSNSMPCSRSVAGGHRTA